MSAPPLVPDSPQRTTLFDSHVDLGARIVPFAGFSMPVSYRDGSVSEAQACRSGTGVFDVSHMGEVLVSGDQAFALLNYATTNDLARLSDGEAQYSLLLTDDGGIIDDVIVYRQSSTMFLIVVNASRRQEDVSRLCYLAKDFNAVIEDISDSKGLIAVQGPRAIETLQILFERGGVSHSLNPVARFTFTEFRMFGHKVLVSRTGYTGEDGVEIMCESGSAVAMWDALIDLGSTPCGLGARDILRLEAGYPLYGHELDEIHSPFESGVGWAVKMRKGEFAGREGLSEHHRPFRKLVGLKALTPANSIPRQGCDVEAEGSNVGLVTSGTLSPSAGAGIALARVESAWAAVGTQLIIDIRGRKVRSEVVATPFVKTSLSM